MPTENRKRGKKNKKKPSEDTTIVGDYAKPFEEAEAQWIVSAQNDNLEVTSEAPFGYVDADIKAYFRIVDEQIRDWQEHEGYAGEVIEDINPNEERRMFFVAALMEMSGKEKQLATDSDCSLILERMSYSMDDFVRRVFIDSLAGSYEILAKHRFASHVCQTLFTLAADTVSRECRGVLPTIPDSSDHGELRTLTQLVLDVCEELLPTFTSLMMDPFASHVIRAILILLQPTLDSSIADRTNSQLRSKRSATWKARQGPMKSVFRNENSKNEGSLLRTTPEQFRLTARKFVQVVRDNLGENEVQALMADKSASPVLQILVEVEADLSMADTPGSLMDRVTIGMVSACRSDLQALPEISAYLNDLLRDPTSSHLFEIVVKRAPDDVFASLWSMYFHGKLARLAVHPVANFVLAKALERVTADQLMQALDELGTAWDKIIKSSRTGVLRAMVDRAAALHTREKEIGDVIFSAFDLHTTADRHLLVPCVLRLMHIREYKAALTSGPVVSKSSTKHGRLDSDDQMEPKTQGAILLQSLLRLTDPHNQLVTNSLNSLPIDELLALAHHATCSRVLDVMLESPTVPFKVKRRLVVSFIGHYQLLVDDRIGSHVGDRCWAFADPYLKEKIARSLIPHEIFLAGSYYGKFFARNLNLHLLQQRPEEWKTLQAERKRASRYYPVTTTSIPSYPDQEKSTVEKKRKREARQADEIDAIFKHGLGKKIKKGALESYGVTSHGGLREPDEVLNLVLGAIRSAPEDSKSHGTKNVPG